MSAVCGVVCHLVVQLAKAQGLKVIATCGSNQKVSLVKSLGADHVFNYKTADTAAELQVHSPIDLYFDLVGGPTLEAAINNFACNARLIICGMISQYNLGTSEVYGVRNLWFFEQIPSEVSCSNECTACPRSQHRMQCSTAQISIWMNFTILSHEIWLLEI